MQSEIVNWSLNGTGLRQVHELEARVKRETGAVSQARQQKEDLESRLRQETDRLSSVQRCFHFMHTSLLPFCVLAV